MATTINNDKEIKFSSFDEFKEYSNTHVNAYDYFYNLGDGREYSFEKGVLPRVVNLTAHPRNEPSYDYSIVVVDTDKMKAIPLSCFISGEWTDADNKPVTLDGAFPSDTLPADVAEELFENGGKFKSATVSFQNKKGFTSKVWRLVRA